MPTVSVKKRLLDKHLAHVYSRDEIEELCFSYGLEVDDVVIETSDDGIKDEVYKIEIPANRYDLLCVEGLCRSLLVFQQKINNPLFQISNVKQPRQILVEPETSLVRPYAAGAIIRNVNIDKDFYASFIDLQEKLHQNICRKRALVAIGTHDLDTIKGNLRYCAKKPQDIVFQPLNRISSFNAAELMDLYADSHLREYLPIIKNKKVYPVFYDEDNVVLSLPPIINSDKTKITLNTKNILIEATGVNLKKLEIVIDTMVTMFSQYSSTPFIIEPVEVVYSDGTIYKYPILNYRKMEVNLTRMNSKIGINLSSKDAVGLLTRMCLSGTPNDYSETLIVTVSPTRHDILHECDIAEDLGLSYGFNNIFPCLPESNTIAESFPLNKLTDALRFNVAMCGWTEVLNFSLCSTDDVSVKLRKVSGRELDKVVKISNPKTMEFQVVRNSLLPGIFKTLACNKDMPIPLKLFEVQDIVVKDEKSETKCRNERRLAAVYYNKTGSFEVIHGLVDRVMQLLDIELSSNVTTMIAKVKTKYFIREETDSTFFDNRCAAIVIAPPEKEPIVVGTFGVLHPEVLTHFNLNMPCTALEINIEPFL